MSIIPFLDIGMQLINKLIPDPEQKANAQLALLKLQQEGEFKDLEANVQIAQGQIDINKIEAASEDDYTRRARPTIMYICGIGFGYQYILQPFFVLLIKCNHVVVDIPNLDMTAIGTVLLGLCGLRSFDKFSKK